MGTGAIRPTGIRYQNSGWVRVRVGQRTQRKNRDTVERWGEAERRHWIATSSRHLSLFTVTARTHVLVFSVVHRTHPPSSPPSAYIHIQAFTRQLATMLIRRFSDYTHPITTVPWRSKFHINTTNGSLVIANVPLYLSLYSLSPLLHSHSLSYPYLPPMPKTRAKNKSTHPAAPVMTPAQLAAAGISQPSKKPRKKQTKDQIIAALEEDLRATRELLQTVFRSFSIPFRQLMRLSQNRLVSVGNTGVTPESQDDGGDTELATDDDDSDYTFTSGRKRSAQRSASTGIKCVDSFPRLFTTT